VARSRLNDVMQVVICKGPAAAALGNRRSGKKAGLQMKSVVATRLGGGTAFRSAAPSGGFQIYCTNRLQGLPKRREMSAV
jgi:hypothetical protein